MVTAKKVVSWGKNLLHGASTTHKKKNKNVNFGDRGAQQKTMRRFKTHRRETSEA